MSEQSDDAMVENRWRAAASLAAGSPSVQATTAVRRARRRRLALVVVPTVVTLAATTLLILFLPGASVLGRSEPPPAQLWTGYAVAGVGFTVATLGFVRAWRRGAFRWAWSSPSAALDRSDRRWLLGRIRCDQSVPSERSAVAVGLAERLARTSLLVPFYAGMMVFWFSQVLTTSSPVLRLVMPVGLAVLAVGLVLLGRDARLARRWLDHHAGSGQRV